MLRLTRMQISRYVESPVLSFVRCRDLFLTTHNTHKRQTAMPPAGFKPATSANERPQTYALDRAAAGINGGSAERKNIGSGKENLQTHNDA